MSSTPTPGSARQASDTRSFTTVSNSPPSKSKKSTRRSQEEKALAADAILTLSRGMPTSPSSRPSSSARKASTSTSKPRPFKCHVCGQAFNKREHVKRHVSLVHDEIRPYSCDVCDLNFGTKQNMQVHFTTKKHRQRARFAASPGGP